MTDPFDPEREKLSQPAPDDVSFDLDAALSSVVGISARTPSDAFTAQTLGTERSGNAVVIRGDGLILTIGYLITEAETIWIVDNAGRACTGHVVGYDQETGFGLVQALDKLDLPVLEIGSSAALSEGDPVIFAGHGGRGQAINAHVISKREFAGYWEYVLDEAIFTAPPHPNWGGGALLGYDGTLRGIGSLFVQQGQIKQAAVNGNMVVPIDLLAPILDDMLTYGKPNRPPRPWLGMFTAEVEDHLMVGGVSDGGPADQAGLQAGDLILDVDGAPVSELAQFYRRVWSHGDAGVEVPLCILRDGNPVEIRVFSATRAEFFKTPRLH